MEIYLAQQTMSFLISALIGAALGVLYDAFRISRVAIPVSAGIVAAEDIIFFSVCSVTTFLFLLGNADGKVRFFLLIGELLGAVLYFCTLSILIMGLSRKIIAFIKALGRFIFRIIIMPVWRLLYAVVSFSLYPLRFINKIIKKALQNVKFSLKKARILLYNQNSLVISRLTRKNKKSRDAAGREDKELI